MKNGKRKKEKIEKWDKNLEKTPWSPELKKADSSRAIRFQNSIKPNKRNTNFWPATSPLKQTKKKRECEHKRII